MYLNLNSELCSKIRTPHLGGVAQSHDGALTAAPRELTLCATLLFHRSGLPQEMGENDAYESLRGACVASSYAAQSGTGQGQPSARILSSF
jgi:hypothetical protein